MAIVARVLTLDKFKEAQFEPYGPWPVCNLLDVEVLRASGIEKVVVLDLEDATVLTDWQEFQDLIARHIWFGYRALVVNLEAVKRVDSVGVGEMVRQYVIAARSGRHQFGLVNAPMHFRELAEKLKFV